MSLINILVGQSGGPSCAINASLAGVISTMGKEVCSVHGEFDKIGKVYGAMNGIQGVIDDHIIDLSSAATKEKLDILKQTPAMALGSCRVKLPKSSSDTKNKYGRIVETLKKYDIHYFFYIGGNDSMDTVLKLNKHFKANELDIKVVGVPKTIDNDLCITDHTPGYGSSARYLCNTISEIAQDSKIYPVENVIVVEIMGRNAGWLTLASAMPMFLGKDFPHIVALPEVAFDEDDFIARVKELLPTKKTVIAVVSEGIKDSLGNYIGMGTKSGITDSFGHLYLSGVGKYLERLVGDKIGCKVRSVELNILQRCSSHLASATDIEESFLIGQTAVVDAAQKQLSGVTYVYDRVSDSPYQIEIKSCDVSLIANKEKRVPKEWRDVYNFDVAKEIVQYLSPLMKGTTSVIYQEDGLPLYLDYLDKK